MCRVWAESMFLRLPMSEQFLRLRVYRQLYDGLAAFFHQNLSHRFFPADRRQHSIIIIEIYLSAGKPGNSVRLA